MQIACWQWPEGIPGYSTLVLARILAEAVCGTTAGRSYHGLMGVRGIGARSLPFDCSKGSYITFYDALQREKSHDAHVHNPKQFLTRFRHPSTPGSDDNRGRGRSFMYFGDHWPCALPTQGDGVILPKLSPKVYIWPTLHNGLWDFQFWLLRIIGLEFMGAKVPKPNHESDSRSEWNIIPISVPDLKSRDGSNDRGFTALVDSGTSQTYLPPSVFAEIRRKWLGLDSRRRETYCEDPEWFKECDIILRFLGLDGAEVPVRISAHDFLCSPYKHGPSGSVYASIAPRPAQNNTESPHAILGQNFFWSVFIKHNFEDYIPEGAYRTQPTGASGPYIQLSPQRVVVPLPGGQSHAYGQDRILLHAHLPGRLEGLRHRRKPMNL
ncbi:hypothetical protein K466DRAFT_295903 [Polyporus arcularius HHB13444]|uniref:Peptidase A1 domain-containing protein n=1 Tax=Polyporus arcularius HHB13444 TaxID=1314778 RepID=A0A5C3P9V3_9APHY|nr:hypothetical protein K466DRAFT_295903 [Polyporus arcularius HHB13444]